MNEYYVCNICGKLIKKENIYGNYENYVCDNFAEKYLEE